MALASIEMDSVALASMDAEIHGAGINGDRRPARHVIHLIAARQNRII